MKQLLDVPDLPVEVPLEPPALPSNPTVADIDAALQDLADEFEVVAMEAIIEPGVEVAVGLNHSLNIPHLTFVDAGGLSVSIPVTATVVWSVHDGGAELIQGLDYHIADPTAAATTFVLRPEPVELTPALTGLAPAERPFDRRTLRATITITAKTSEVEVLGLAEDRSASIELDVRLRLVKLPIPTILALFRHTRFAANDPTKLGGRRDGAALLLVPTSSPFADQQVDPLLASLADLTSTAAALAEKLPGATSLTSFLESLAKLTAALSVHLATPRASVVIAARDREDNLNTIEVIDRSGFLRNDIEANNEISSLTFVARPDRVAHLFNKRGREAGRGHLKLKTGDELSVLIEDLHLKGITGQPLDGAVPADGAIVIDDAWWTFGDAVSSFEFADEATTDQARRPVPAAATRRRNR